MTFIAADGIAVALAAGTVVNASTMNDDEKMIIVSVTDEMMMR